MYDHIRRGWFAISFTMMGFVFVGFVLSLFMIGERPLGLLPFQRNKRGSENRNLDERTPREKLPEVSVTAIAA